ncbi:MAG: hypothetical protein ACREFQ_23475, partial [Stellaceae bacterium]
MDIDGLAYEIQIGERPLLEGQPTADRLLLIGWQRACFAGRVAGESVDRRNRAMPLSTDEKLLALSRDVIEGFDRANGGVHPGFRPAHAKGILLEGVFTPSSEAASLTRAPHIQRNSTPVTVRFSDFAGIPTVPDNDPQG